MEASAGTKTPSTMSTAGATAADGAALETKAHPQHPSTRAAAKADPQHPSKMLVGKSDTEKAAIPDSALFGAAVDYLHQLALAYPRCSFPTHSNVIRRSCNCHRQFLPVRRDSGDDGGAIRASPLTEAVARQIVFFIKLDPEKQSTYIKEWVQGTSSEGWYAIPGPPDEHGDVTSTIKACWAAMQLVTGKGYDCFRSQVFAVTSDPYGKVGKKPRLDDATRKDAVPGLGNTEKTQRGSARNDSSISQVHAPPAAQGPVVSPPYPQATGLFSAVSVLPGAKLGVLIGASQLGYCFVRSVVNHAMGFSPGDLIIAVNNEPLPLSSSPEVWKAMLKKKESTHRVVYFYRRPMQPTPRFYPTSVRTSHCALPSPPPPPPAFPGSPTLLPPAMESVQSQWKSRSRTRAAPSSRDRNSMPKAPPLSVPSPASGAMPCNGTDGAATVDSAHAENSGSNDDDDDGEILEVWTAPAAGDGESQGPKSGALPHNGADGADGAHATNKEGDGGGGDAILDDEPEILCPPRRIKRRRPVRCPSPPTSESSYEHVTRAISSSKGGNENEEEGYYLVSATSTPTAVSSVENRVAASIGAPVAQGTCNSPSESSAAAASAASPMAEIAAIPQASEAPADTKVIDVGDLEKIREERRSLSRNVQLQLEQVELLRLKLQAKKAEEEARDLREQLKKYEGAEEESE